MAHKVATARRVPAAFGVFFNSSFGPVPCEAYTIDAEGNTTSGDDATCKDLADAFERGEAFLTYEAFVTQEGANGRAIECGKRCSVRPLPAGWCFYIGEQLCVVAPAEPARAEPNPVIPSTSFSVRRYFVHEDRSYCDTHPANATHVLVIYEDLNQGIRNGEQPNRSYTLIPLNKAA
ncbi:hypothetical protein AB7M49_007004 [Bradyrhizobium elkanii]